MKNKNLNLDLKNLPAGAKKLANKFKRFEVITFIVLLVGLYGFLILQISSSATREPTQAEVMEELGSVKRLRIDQASIDKIQQLEDQNVVVQSLFEDARQNPFSE